MFHGLEGKNQRHYDIICSRDVTRPKCMALLEIGFLPNLEFCCSKGPIISSVFSKLLNTRMYIHQLIDLPINIGGEAACPMCRIFRYLTMIVHTIRSSIQLRKRDSNYAYIMDLAKSVACNSLP